MTYLIAAAIIAALVLAYSYWYARHRRALYEFLALAIRTDHFSSYSLGSEWPNLLLLIPPDWAVDQTVRIKASRHPAKIIVTAPDELLPALKAKTQAEWTNKIPVYFK